MGRYRCYTAGSEAEFPRYSLSHDAGGRPTVKCDFSDFSVLSNVGRSSNEELRQNILGKLCVCVCTWMPLCVRGRVRGRLADEVCVRTETMCLCARARVRAHTLALSWA